MAGNVRNSRTTHPRKAARRAGALQRFTVGEHAQTNAVYRKAKAIEQFSLERSLGIPSSSVLLSVVAGYKYAIPA